MISAEPDIDVQAWLLPAKYEEYLHDYKCCVCMSLLPDVCLTAPCEHVLCAPCATKLAWPPACPECRQRLHVHEATKRNRIMSNQVGRLELWCTLGVDLCAGEHKETKEPPHKVSFSNWERHRTSECPKRRVKCDQCNLSTIYSSSLEKHRTETCAMRRVVCRNGCRELVLADSVDKHDASCTEVRLRCVNNQCSHICTRGVMRNHRSVCAHEVVKCAGEAHGCTFSGERSTYMEHLNRNVTTHLVYLLHLLPPNSLTRDLTAMVNGVASRASETKAAAAKEAETKAAAAKEAETKAAAAKEAETKAAAAKEAEEERIRIATVRFIESLKRMSGPKPPILVADKNDCWYVAEIVDSKESDDPTSVLIRYILYDYAEERVPMHSGRMRSMYDTADEHAAFLAGLKPSDRLGVRWPDATEWRDCVVTAATKDSITVAAIDAQTEAPIILEVTREYAIFRFIPEFMLDAIITADI